MAKFTITIADTENGIDYQLESGGDIDPDNPSPAALLMVMLNDYLQEALREDYDAEDE